MRRKRWTVRVAILASLACPGLVVLSAWPAAPGITRANFARLEEGMTRAEAEMLLGGPPTCNAPNGRTWFGLLLT